MPKHMGPYELGHVLGRGGMGTVYEASNVETGERAAVKVLPDFLMEDVGFRQRFDIEIEVLRKLRHPNIVRLLGFGEQDGLLFYSMELVEGASLQQQLRRGRRFHWKEVVALCIGICRALRHAHDRGIVHRDIKPANVLLADRIDGKESRAAGPPSNATPASAPSPITVDHVKLSDFGIAQLFGEARLTSAGAVVGTIEFMAPEQAAAEVIGPRADLYSLGVVAYLLLTGRPPFAAKSLPEIVKKQRQGTVESILHFDFAVPRELDELVRQLLRPNPLDRPSTADVLRRRLENLWEMADRLAAAERETRCLVATDDSAEPKAGSDFDLASQVEIVEGAAPSHCDLQQATRNISTPRSASDVGRADESKPKPPTRSLAAATSEVDAPSPAGDCESAVEEPVAPTVDAPLEPWEPNKTAADADGQAIDPAAESEQVDDRPTADDGGPRTATEKPSPASATATATGTSRSHFTPIRDQDLDPAPEGEAPHALLSIHTWVLVISLLVIGFVVWRFLQPPTAEELHARVQDTIAEGTIDTYRKAETDMRDFLARFPNDPRGEALEKHLRELELSNQERQFERRIGDMTAVESLLPIERAYLEAITEARRSPERGVARLQALVDLYGLDAPRSDEPQAGPAGVYVELASRRIDRLRTQIEAIAAEEKVLIETKLDRADALEATNPQRADAIRRSIVTLYREKPWAETLVSRARSAVDGGQRSPEHAPTP